MKEKRTEKNDVWDAVIEKEMKKVPHFLDAQSVHLLKNVDNASKRNKKKQKDTISNSSNSQKRKRSDNTVKSTSWAIFKAKTWREFYRRLLDYDFKKILIGNNNTSGTYKVCFQHCFFVKNKPYLWKYICRRLNKSELKRCKNNVTGSSLQGDKNLNDTRRIWEVSKAETKFKPIKIQRNFVEIKNLKISIENVTSSNTNSTTTTTTTTTNDDNNKCW